MKKFAFILTMAIAMFSVASCQKDTTSEDLNSQVKKGTTNTNPAGLIVGKMINNVPTITLNHNNMKVSWEHHLSTKQIITTLNEFKIVKHQAEFVLQATSTDRTLKSGIELIYVAPNFHIYERLTGIHTTCECVGCTEGCNPKKASGEWYCTSCANSPGANVCTKTVTATDGGGLVHFLDPTQGSTAN